MKMDRVKRYINRGYSLWMPKSWEQYYHDRLENLEAELRLGESRAPRTFSIMNIKKETDKEIVEWVYRASMVGSMHKLADVPLAKTPYNLFYGGAVPPPDFSLFDEGDSNKHIKTREFIMRAKAHMHLIADIGYMAYTHAAGGKAFLRVERVEGADGSQLDIASIVRDIFKNPTAPDTERYRRELMDNGRGYNALNSSIATWVRNRNVELPPVSDYAA